MSNFLYKRIKDLEFEVNWQWPLQLRVIGEEKLEEKTEQLSSPYWAKQFFKIHPLNERLYNASIYFSDLGLKETILKIHSLKFQLECDAVLIMESSFDELLKEYGLTENDPNNNIWKLLERLAKKTQASGVFIIPGDNISAFAGELSIQLAHNESLPKIISIINLNSIALYDRDLDRYANLSHYLKRLSISLAMRRNQKVHNYSSIFEQSEYTSRRLADELYLKHAQFEFDHESGIAEPIIELVKNLEKELGTLTPPFGKEFKEQERLFLKNKKKGESTDRNRYLDDIVQEAMAQPEEAAAAEEEENPTTRGETAPAPRFLQAKITSTSTHEEKSTLTYLHSNSLYYIHIRIGEMSGKWIQNIMGELDTSAVHSGGSKMETIELLVHSQIDDQLFKEKLYLPVVGNSGSVHLPFNTAQKMTNAKIHIIAYHKNTPLQSITLIFSVCEKHETVEPGFHLQAHLDVNHSFLFGKLKERNDFDLSISVDRDGSAIVKHDEGGEIVRNAQTQISMIKLTKELEETALISLNKGKLFHDKEITLLAEMARIGVKFYKLLLTPKLRKLEGAVQVMSRHDEYIPLEFIYQFESPEEKVDLCAHAIDALENGSCGDCPNANNRKKVVCPLGFWSMNRIIERFHHHRISAKPKNVDNYLQSLQKGDRSNLPIFNKTLSAYSEKIKLESIENISDALGTVTDLSTVDSWEDWKGEISQEYDSLILVLHNEMGDLTEKLEIKGNPMSINSINKEYIDPKLETGPIVILLGCRTSNTNNNKFRLSQTFLESASAVISNFTNLYGRQAEPILTTFSKIIKEKEGQTTTLGEIMLQLRRKLLTLGLMNSFTLLLEGDATFEVEL